ncbi:MAG: carbon-nitrogen hydrolase family protein [Nitrospinota bacterium]
MMAESELYAPPPRPVRVAAFQTGAGTPGKAANIRGMVTLLERASEEEPVDLAVFPELATTPYFCGARDKAYLNWAEPIPGKTTKTLGEAAGRLGCHIVFGMYERANERGEFYNSAVVLDPEGRIVPGHLPGGQEVRAYRKCHLSELLVNEDNSPGSQEKYYFRPGPGLAVFPTRVGVLGILICYDRSFPECWRVLALSGAEIVLVPTASYRVGRDETFTMEIQTACVQNAVFAVAANKGGLETCMEADRHFFGASCVVNPKGEVLARGPVREGPEVVRATIDLADIYRHSFQYNFYRDRRPELYGSILKTVPQ